MLTVHCPSCGNNLGTSLTSCMYCGWSRIDPMPRENLTLPPPAGFVASDEHARIVAEKDARIARLREACNQSRLAFAGYVSAQSAIDALDRAALKGDDNG